MPLWRVTVHVMVNHCPFHCQVNFSVSAGDWKSMVIKTKLMVRPHGAWLWPPCKDANLSLRLSVASLYVLLLQQVQNSCSPFFLSMGFFPYLTTESLFVIPGPGDMPHSV